MSRPKSLCDVVVVSVRIEKSMYDLLQDLSALETLNTSRVVSINELIRGALDFTYSDNERLRESFKRSRAHMEKKIKY